MIPGMVADKDSSRAHMTTVESLSIHGVSAGSGVLSPDAVVHSPRLFRPFSLALLSRRTIPVRRGASGCRTPRQGGNGEGPGVVCVLFRVRKKILRSLISAGSVGFSPSGLCPPCGIPSGLGLLWMSNRSRNAGTKYWRQWRGALGNYEKVD